MSMNGNAGISTNGVPTNHFSERGHTTLPLHQQSQSRDQWSQMVPQEQPQPQFYSAPWQQTQPVQPAAVPQAFVNQQQHYQNSSSAPLDFSSVVSQQIMQDFLRLSTPVGSSPNDDTTLAQALYESRQTGKTYRQALEGLHGVNNHAANLWKDYYLDHHDRFDLLVSRLAAGQPKTVKKPLAVVSSKPSHQALEEGTSQQVARKRHISPQPHSPPTLSPRQTPKKRGRPPGPSQASRRTRVTPPPVTTATSVLARPVKRPRATFNSLTGPLLSNDVPNLMPPQVHIPLPDPPSRSPTPPTTVQVSAHGNKYTKEDREYFIKFLLWRLKQDPSLTKREICELLHEKAPQHTANSWASHWHQRHDIADKILATYRDLDFDVSDDQQDEEEEGEVEAEIKDDQDDDDDTMSANETSRDQKGRLRSQGTFSGDTDVVDTEEDEANMGEPGSSFTRGDWCILARFIARNHWDEMSHKERWQAFTETYATQRPGRSWAEFYRKNEVEILKLSKKYSPEIGRGNKNRHERSSRQKRWANAHLDEDGDNETDSE